MELTRGLLSDRWTRRVGCLENRQARLIQVNYGNSLQFRAVDLGDEVLQVLECARNSKKVPVGVGRTVLWEVGVFDQGRGNRRNIMTNPGQTAWVQGKD